MSKNKPKQKSDITWHTEKRRISELIPYDHNPRQMTEKQARELRESIEKYDLAEIPAINTDNVLAAGHMRIKILLEMGRGEEEIDVRVPNRKLNEEEFVEYLLRSNKNTGGWDNDTLANDFDPKLLEKVGFDQDYIKVDEDKETEAHAKLTESFVVPPFSVLDTRQGYWQERKGYWKNVIKDFGESREHTLSKGEKNILGEINSGVSILDPVLAEIAVKWFAPDECKTFDCFAGDNVFGYVSGYIGNSFTGIELRQEQVDLNNKRTNGMLARYICDDAQNVLDHIKENSQDLLFSCPPYFDLEVYSSLPNDASNQQTYADFLKILENAFKSAIKCLKDDRFAVIVVGDIRDKNGFYYRFPDDIKRIFTQGGMELYNEMILVEALGTLPQRVNKLMGNRKVGKCHQNVLVFYKGNPKTIKDNFKKLTFSEVENEG